eukprot:3211665-Amphidinium_carterae.1
MTFLRPPGLTDIVLAHHAQANSDKLFSKIYPVRGAHAHSRQAQCILLKFAHRPLKEARGCQHRVQLTRQNVSQVDFSTGCR